MGLYSAFDAAYPPGTPYPGAQAVMGYIGGNTPHIWTAAEWQRFSHLVQFPIWVGYQEADPATHGSQAVAAMTALGWAEHRPNRRAVIIDEETEVDDAWLNAFASVIWAAGYETYVYGSQSTVIDMPPKEGRVIALYNGTQDIPAGEAAVAHQYRANVPWDGTQVDLSMVTSDMMAHGGIGPRK